MKYSTVLFAAALLTTSVAVHADADFYRDSAKVIQVEPIVSWHKVPVRRRICKPRRRHDHDDDYYSDNNRSDRGGDDYLLPAVLGALHEGGWMPVGNNRYGRHHHGHKRCRVVTEYRRERHVDGYRVSYRYRGHEFTTRTETRPGRRIPVRVRLSPVY